MGDTALVLHGHFYQPPHENPWTEVVPVERSAAPFHDWNERVTAECYRPNGWARVVDDHGRVVAIVDNYERLSFNVGPTLLSWLAERHPDVYERMVEADSLTGRAIAQAWGHAILPLCDDHDLRTHIRWGLADFEHRFGHPAEGMWLPETAVDDRVLAALAEEGIGFTILAPGQADMDDVGLDTREPYRWRHPERDDLGVTIVFYDGALSHDIAFGGVASQTLVARAAAAAPDGGLVCLATDGETFGHHHPYADRGVAYALAVEAERHGLGVPRLADWLRDHPPERDARVKVSSWSCAHGVERWLSDCGCHTGGEPGWNQAWRGPLRAALDVLRDHAVAVMDARGAKLFRDPWAARDAYIAVLLGAQGIDAFAAEHIKGDLVEALTLLEASRHTLAMYTSCGWFFNDLAGIETVQILRYAARCIDLLDELGEPVPLEEFLDVLAQAASNQREEGDGRQIWRRHVEPSRVDARRVASHLALVDLLGSSDADGLLGGYHVERDIQRRADRGGLVASAGRVALVHRRTRRRTEHVYAALHLGGLEVFGATRPSNDAERDSTLIDALLDAVAAGERVPGLLRRVVDDFGPDEFGLESALPDAADQILAAIADGLTDRFAEAYRRLRHDHAETLAALATAGYELPTELRVPVELALTRELNDELVTLADEIDPDAYRVARAIAVDARAEGVTVDSPGARDALGRAILRAVGAAIATPDEPHVEAAVGMVRLVRELGVAADLDHVQAAVHDTLTSGTAGAEALRPLGVALGLAVDQLMP